MAFDPSIISSIPDFAPHPLEATEKALTLKDMMDRGQLNQLQLSAAKKQASESEQVDKILKGSDYTTPEGLASTAAKVNRVSPRSAMELLQTGQKYQTGQIEQQLQMLTLATQRQDLIVQAIDPIVAQARTMKNSGASDLDVKAFITQQMPQALEGLRQMKMPDGKPALPDDVLKMASTAPRDLATLEGWESKSKAGAAAIKERLEQFKADTQAKAERTRERSEDEKEKHDRATEDATRRREAVAAHKSAGFDDRESELLAALADRNVSLPSGLRSQGQIKATLNGLLTKHADQTPDQIADGIRTGRLKLSAETSAARVAGTQIGKVALAANELDTFGDQVLTASGQLHDWVRKAPVGLTMRGLMQMGEKQASNTGLLMLKLKLQALNNAYEQLASRGGTDQEKRAHIHELFDSRLTDAGIQTLVTGVRQEAAAAREAADRTIAETAQEAIPGTGKSPGAGATPGQNLPAVPGRTSAPTGKTKSYQHPSGATVEILDN